MSSVQYRHRVTTTPQLSKPLVFVKGSLLVSVWHTGVDFLWLVRRGHHTQGDITSLLRMLLLSVCHKRLPKIRLVSISLTCTQLSAHTVALSLANKCLTYLSSFLKIKHWYSRLPINSHQSYWSIRPKKKCGLINRRYLPPLSHTDNVLHWGSFSFLSHVAQPLWWLPWFLLMSWFY